MRNWVPPVIAFALFACGCSERSGGMQNDAKEEAQTSTAIQEPALNDSLGDREYHVEREVPTSAPVGNSEQEAFADSIFVASCENLALTGDGRLYAFQDDDGTGEVTWREIADDVIGLNPQVNTAGAIAPDFQTADHRFFRLVEGEVIEMLHDLQGAYSLCGGRMVRGEDGLLYRLDWPSHQEWSVSDAALLELSSGAYAYDMNYDVLDDRALYYVVYLTDDGGLVAYNSGSRTSQELDSDVVKFYAGLSSKMGGGGCGIWYLKADGTLHILLPFLWESEKTLHYQYNGVLDFWKVNEWGAVILDGNNNLQVINSNVDNVSFYATAPQNGVSNVLSVNVYPPSDPQIMSFPTPEYLLIDGDGKLRLDLWAARFH